MEEKRERGGGSNPPPGGLIARSCHKEEEDEEEGSGGPGKTQTVRFGVILGVAGLHEGQRVHTALLQSRLVSQGGSLQHISLA